MSFSVTIRMATPRKQRHAKYGAVRSNILRVWIVPVYDVEAFEDPVSDHWISWFICKHSMFGILVHIICNMLCQNWIRGMGSEEYSNYIALDVMTMLSAIRPRDAVGIADFDIHLGSEHILQPSLFNRCVIACPKIPNKRTSGSRCHFIHRINHGKTMEHRG